MKPPSSAGKRGSQFPVVLVIEEEDAIRSLIRRTLEEEGCAVLESASAMEALKLVDVRPEGIDLIVADLATPGMRGTAGLQGHLSARTKVLFISIGTDASSPAQRTADDVPVFLHRPFRPNALRDKVRELFGRTPPAAKSRGDELEK